MCDNIALPILQLNFGQTPPVPSGQVGRRQVASEQILMMISGVTRCGSGGAAPHHRKLLPYHSKKDIIVS